MFRLLLPIIFVGIAGGLFFMYTDPTYQSIKDLSSQQAEYDQALTKAQDLLSIRNKLIAKRNTFSPDDINKIERVLPDNVDNIRLILDTETIAQRYQLHVQDIALKTPQASRDSKSQLAVGDTGDPVGSVVFSFTVTAKYDDFTRFLKDLERSVRIVDVQSIAFSVGQGELSDYTVSIKTYWLKK